ncbi:YafY family protein [Paenibacillus sp. YN15]|uniref:helix-turn-helix transcriptional regulator n=1 Tax=Paenibacillus sp. YN15 TaxID=1742774 RepID=UPI000DCB20F9|nr:WYL domain-containing protein [Paenibacillus sp. YN15]RAV01676.1 transcriptional regulator [Paenibacillus sp. YN15]
MRADRLIQLLVLLQQSEKWTAKELAARLEVSERTVHRDMEALSMAGFPVLADRGANGGWYLQEGYRSLLTGMNRSDIKVLLMPELAARGMDSRWGEAFQRVSQKLLGALPQGWREQAELVRQRIYVDGAGWYARTPDEQETVLSVLQDALWAGKKVEFLYGAGDGEATGRTASPCGLVVKGTVWYLVAAPDGDGDTGVVAAEALRTYRVSRIRHVRMTEMAAAAIPPGFDLAAYWEASLVRFREQLPVYPAVVEGDPEGIRQLGETRFVRLLRTEGGEGGQVRAQVEFNTMESAASIILGLQGAVAAVEPAELVRDVAAKAARLAGLHGLPGQDLAAEGNVEAAT